MPPTTNFASRNFFLALLFRIVLLKTQSVAATSQSATVPPPIVIPASQNWVGNDGPWSSFTLQVGTPAQDVDVLISTAGDQTWVVLPQGCTSSDPANCATLRGNEFYINQSTSWVPNNFSASGLFQLGLEANLGYTGNGEFGYDTVGLGWQGSGGPTLNQQVVAGIATKEFYLGIFGLSPRPTNFSTFDNPVASYIENLKNKSLIPSLSWSYTAGAKYRLDQVLGNLVIGGYDASRFVPNDVTFDFNAIDARDLTVNIDTIIIASANASNTVIPTNIAAFIDSTIPYIFLPLEVCQQFETAFGIVWDNDVQAYLVNDTFHTKLQAQNASVTFVLGNSSANSIVNITLPYAAFDLIANYPLVENATNYFPLMRATNDTQYTLGRTFLQEAYLTADYERRNFSVSQCSWIANSQQHIIPIVSQTNQQNATSINPPSSSPTPSHLPTAAIAGIVVGIVLLALLTVFGLLYYRRRKPRRDKQKYAHEVGTGEEDKTELPGQEHKNELDAKATQLNHEIDGKLYPGMEIDGVQYPGAELETPGLSYVHEMPAREEPASELLGSHGIAAEMM